MTTFEVGDYFWAPFVPVTGERGEWDMYDDSPVIARVEESHPTWVRAHVLAIRGDREPRYCFGDDRIVRLSEDTAWAMVAAFRLTGEVPTLLEGANNEEA